MTESVVLCEGYHDRAFWAGLLLFLNCTDPGIVPGGKRRMTKDIRGETVTAGQFYYYTQTGNGLRVVPCQGKDNILPTLDRFLTERGTKPFARLVVNVDPDTDVANASNVTTGLRVQDVLRRVQQPKFDPLAQLDSNGEIVIDQGSSRVALVRWEVADAPGEGLPDQQTLERLVCAAMVAAYPQRGPHVQKWLDARPDLPPFSVKEFAWSHMAGWYAEHGCDDFYRCLWDDTAISVELKARLQASGAWQIAEALANEP